MLFHSVPFLFVFLPICVCLFYFLRRINHTASLGFLALASFFFYGYWKPIYLPILIASIAFNYFMGHALRPSDTQEKSKKNLLIFGITANLALLFFFKYAEFAIETLMPVTALQPFLNTISAPIADIALPLAISFFTFQQIAWLVDSYKGKAKYHSNFINYCVFVTFFPQLIAGPIVHHREMMPQFNRQTPDKPKLSHIHVGIAFLVIGLFKKICIADTFAPYADVIFDGEPGAALNFYSAWVGALAYSFQIYFDFSGYCDMALGAARLFGIRLPVNFFSPYKARNIVDFWRRWHITLSRFLRDYLYIPLGGNRHGLMRRYANLSITMLLGGLWHGAGFGFIIWGGLHGLYLCVNHAMKHMRIPAMPKFPAQICTFIAATIAWVFFRATDVDTAFTLLQHMFDMQQAIELSFQVEFFEDQGAMRQIYDMQSANLALPFLLIAGLICLFAPNSGEIMRKYKPFIRGTAGLKMSKGGFRLVWQPTKLAGFLLGLMACIAVVWMLYEPSQVFLYFQF